MGKNGYPSFWTLSLSETPEESQCVDDSRLDVRLTSSQISSG